LWREISRQDAETQSRQEHKEPEFSFALFAPLRLGEKSYSRARDMNLPVIGPPSDQHLVFVA